LKKIKKLLVVTLVMLLAFELVGCSEFIDSFDTKPDPEIAGVQSTAEAFQFLVEKLENWDEIEGTVAMDLIALPYSISATVSARTADVYSYGTDDQGNQTVDDHYYFDGTSVLFYDDPGSSDYTVYGLDAYVAMDYSVEDYLSMAKNQTFPAEELENIVFANESSHFSLNWSLMIGGEYYDVEVEYRKGEINCKIGDLAIVTLTKKA